MLVEAIANTAFDFFVKKFGVMRELPIQSPTDFNDLPAGVFNYIDHFAGVSRHGLVKVIASIYFHYY